MNNKPYKNITAFANKTEQQLDSPGIAVMKPVSDLCTDTVDYRNCHIIQKFPLCKDKVANEINMMTRKASIQIKERIFDVKHPLSIVAFFEDFMAACIAFQTHEGAAK